MAGTQTTLRLDQRIKDTIDRLVEEGRYPSMTAFIIEAILLKLDVEGIAVDGMEREPDALERYFASPAGERLLSRLIRQELETIQMVPRTVSHLDDPVKPSPRQPLHHGRRTSRARSRPPRSSGPAGLSGNGCSQRSRRRAVRTAPGLCRGPHKQVRCCRSTGRRVARLPEV